MKAFRKIADFESEIGNHLGYSDWHTITQSQIDAFADATGDHLWIHVDTEAAAKGPFGSTIAHGFLTLSLLPMLIQQVWQMSGFSMGMNYGCNKVRFPAVVKVNDRVRLGAELTGVTVTGAGAQITMAVTFESEGSAKPVCVAEWVFLAVE